MIITKKKLIKKAAELYLENDTSKAHDADDFRFRAGNANALNALCYRFGIDLTEYVRAAKEPFNE